MVNFVLLDEGLCAATQYEADDVENYPYQHPFISSMLNANLDKYLV